MFNSKNTFKETMNNFNAPTNTITLTGETLTDAQKKQLLTQTKMHIQMEKVIADLATFFVTDEAVVGYLPLTNESNSSIATIGIMGATYVNTAEGKKYRDDFNDLRGNRLLIFTNKQIYFMVIIEFIEEKIFYTYPFDKIDAIRLQKNKLGYFDWDNGKILPNRKYKYWYTLDYQAGSRVFTEMLSPHDTAKFKQIIAQIPELASLPLDKKVKRQTKFDSIFNNLQLAKRVYTLFWIILAVVFFGSILFQLITRQGMWYDIFFNYDGALSHSLCQLSRLIPI